MKARSLASLSLLAALHVACPGSQSGSGGAPTHSSSGDDQPANTASAADASAPATDAATVAARPAVDPAITAVIAAYRSENSQLTSAPTVLFGPTPIVYPGESGPRVVAVVSAQGARPLLVYTAVPYVEEQRGWAAIDCESAQITGMVVRPINNDPRPDIAVFTNHEDVTEGYLPLQFFTQFYTLQTEQERSLAPLLQAQAALAGVRSEAELTQQLPTLGHFEAPTATTSPMRFIARLHYATREQFLSVVSSSGLRLCADVPGRDDRRRKTCRTVRGAQITAELDARYNIRRTISQLADVHLPASGDLANASCSREGNQVRCNANVNGPAGVDWTLTVEGGVYKLAEVSHWHESS